VRVTAVVDLSAAPDASVAFELARPHAAIVRCSLLAFPVVVVSRRLRREHRPKRVDAVSSSLLAAAALLTEDAGEPSQTRQQPRGSGTVAANTARLCADSDDRVIGGGIAKPGRPRPNSRD